MRAPRLATASKLITSVDSTPDSCTRTPVTWLSTSTGMTLPSLPLSVAGGGRFDLREAATIGTLVAFVYPRTGTPGQPLVPGDGVPGDGVPSAGASAGVSAVSVLPAVRPS